MNNIINAIVRPDGNLAHCVLATIIERKGSAPRSSGSRMVIFPDRSIQGTIGGGILEAGVIDFAIELIENKTKQKPKAITKDFHFDGVDAASMDMICGGEVKVLFEVINSDDPEIVDVFTHLKNVVNSKLPGWYVYSFDPSELYITRGVVTKDQVWGSVDIPLEIVRAVSDVKAVDADGKTTHIARLDRGGSVLVFGGGHVAQPVVSLCSMVEFRVTVIDDRDDYANRDRFPSAALILVPDRMENVFNQLIVDKSTSIVIITRGHLQDNIVAAWALTTRAGYIGMIGSRRKWAMIKEDLLGKGFTDADLLRIHSPIGIDIQAETPAEIAVSIVAELIKYRAIYNRSER